MGIERRMAQRFILSPNTSTISRRGGYRHLCIVKNVSVTGMLVELSLDDGIPDLKVGDMLSLDQPDADMDVELPRPEGEVVWIHENKIGVRFADEIDFVTEALRPDQV